MLIQKNTFNVLGSCCHFEKTRSAMPVCLDFFGADAKRLGSSPVKMSQAFHTSFCSNFLNFPAPKG